MIDRVLTSGVSKYKSLHATGADGMEFDSFVDVYDASLYALWRRPLTSLSPCRYLHNRAYQDKLVILGDQEKPVLHRVLQVPNEVCTPVSGLY